MYHYRIYDKCKSKTSVRTYIWYSMRVLFTRFLPTKYVGQIKLLGMK